MPTVHAIVEGLVQGVAFREYTRRQAVSLGLNGWVRNLHNGAVEAMVQGSAEQVEAMRQWLQHGSPHARVERLLLEEVAQPEQFSSFEIRF
jgi:acylphosphatase